MRKKLNRIIIGIILAAIFLGTLAFASPQLAETICNNIKYSLCWGSDNFSSDLTPKDFVNLIKEMYSSLGNNNYDKYSNDINSNRNKSPDSSVPQNISDIATKEESYYDYIENNSALDTIKKVDDSFKIAVDAFNDLGDIKLD